MFSLRGIQSGPACAVAALKNICKPWNFLPAVAMSSIKPPASVRGMKILDKSAFAKDIEVPVLCVPDNVLSLSVVRSALKQYLIDVAKFKAIQPANETERLVYLHPDQISTWNDFDAEDREKLESRDIKENCMNRRILHLTYANWDAHDTLNAIIGESAPNVAGFSRIGHIIHLNLREEHEDYKKVIGEVLLEKIPGIKTILNKVNIIENEFRNINYEILAGSSDLRTISKENGCSFHLDYGEVYWNPRLSTEHERIVKEIPSNAVIFDVFAGIGPFAIPCAKKGCRVFANDLNPASFKWLQKNIEANKVSGKIDPYNMDGREFILSIMPKKLQELYYEDPNADILILMNLPALAETFLGAFDGLLHGFTMPESFREPTVHLYCFDKGRNEEAVMERLRIELHYDIAKEEVTRFFVRQVAPNKDMLRLRFQLPRTLLLRTAATVGILQPAVSADDAPDGPLTKKLKAEVDGRR